VPKHIVRYPRPEGEWERDWSEFKRRAGLDQPREPEPPPPSRWERWQAFNRSTGAKVMFLVALAAFIYGGQLAFDKFPDPGSLEVTEPREYAAVAFDTGWISLGDGIEVQMPREAALKVDAQNLDGMKHVVLEGEARFRVLPLDNTSRVLRKNALYVETSAGSVWAGEADFTVTAGDSSTAVTVHPLGPRRTAMPNLRTVMISRKRPYVADHLGLLDSESGRLVRGQDPTRVAVR
jgi:ferric-dicitrate binding protein FerR (iron transport regulator)